VFVHAYLKPKRSLTSLESRIKQSAKSIISRVNDGETVVTSVVHFGEVSNILEDNMSLNDAQGLERAICFKENVEIISVAHEDYLAALYQAEGKQLGINDALTYVLMKKRGIDEIYSYDKDFDSFQGITRVTT
jgi:predicted nucleic acid-binding protein